LSITGCKVVHYSIYIDIPLCRGLRCSYICTFRNLSLRISVYIYPYPCNHRSCKIVKIDDAYIIPNSHNRENKKNNNNLLPVRSRLHGTWEDQSVSSLNLVSIITYKEVDFKRPTQNILRKPFVDENLLNTVNEQ